MTKPIPQLLRVTVSYEVLMPVEDETRLHDMELSDIHMECQNGAWSGSGPTINTVELLTGDQLCRAACAKQGTDLEFFTGH